MPSATGSKNAANPNTWNSKSDAYAPTGPIQFRAGCSSAAGPLTLNAASLGEYEIKASPVRTANVMHRKPISSLSRLFSVGVRKRTEFSSAFWGRPSAAGGAALSPLLEERQNHTIRPAPHKPLFAFVSNCAACLMDLRVPHPSRSLRRMGSYDPTPPPFFSSSLLGSSVLSVSSVVSRFSSPKLVTQN